MFLVSVTSDRPPEELSAKRLQSSQMQVGTHSIAAITDGLLSRFEAEPTGFSVIESLPADLTGTPGRSLVRVTLDATRRTLSISQATHSPRPIYYHFDRQGEFHCSTHISMLRMAGVPIDENVEAVPEFLLYQGVQPPRTIYRDIRRVCFGGAVTVDLGERGCSLRSEDSYSPFRDRPGTPLAGSPDDAVREVHDTLLRSVDHLAPHASRLAVLQSGGLDSSILFTLCRDRLGTDRSYSASYPLKGVTRDAEAEYATSAAEALHSVHTWYSPSVEEYLFGLLGALAAAEEPLKHLQSVMIYLLMREAVPKDADVVLSALWADTIFGTQQQKDLYRWHTNGVYRLLSREPVHSLFKVGSALTGRGRGHLATMETLANNAKRGLEDPRHLAHFGNSYHTYEPVCDYFGTRLEDVVGARGAAIESLGAESIYDVLSASELEGTYVLTTLWSKLAEQTGRHFYCPFTEREVLETGYAIPWEAKLSAPKRVLRDLAGTLGIPEFIITRPKSGFGWPPERWGSRGGAFEALLPLASKTFGKGELAMMQTSETGTAILFWNMLNYAIWRRLFIDNEPLDLLRDELARSIADVKART